MTDRTHDAFDIAAQEDARARTEERAKQKARVAISDIQWLMAKRQGRRFAHGLLERAGVYRSSFNANALTMAFNEGTRNEGLALLAKLMEHAPEMYALMLKEQRDDE